MNRELFESYLTSLLVFKNMMIKGILTKEEYIKAENLLAKKYCINKGNLYRQNDLILSDFRAIYVLDNKEVQNGN